MKKIIYILIALTSFSIGVSAFGVYFLFDSDSLDKVKEITPLSNVDKHFKLYAGNKITLQEDLVVDKESDWKLRYYLIGRKLECETKYTDCRGTPYQDCINNGDIHFVNPVGQKEVQLITEIAERNSQLEKNNSDGVFTARVEITGYVRDAETFDDYSIDVTEIKQISPIRLVSGEEMSKPN